MMGDLMSSKIEGPAVFLLHVARPEPVADEEIARDPLDLLAVHEVVARPPAFEWHEACWLGVRVREHAVVLVPVGVCGIEGLEVLDEVRPVEKAVPEIRCIR